MAEKNAGMLQVMDVKGHEVRAWLPHCVLVSMTL
jgi:hypothetical protein